ncbi:MAG: Gfo/Idh/MocA family oxidoreductase [Candidatus Hydrogenedentales bacterium]|jgi:predicted dehydrogenase
MNRRQFLWAGGSAAALAALPAAAQEKKGESAMLRVAMLSQWHVHAKGYAESLRKMPDVKLTVVWDEIPERGKGWADSLGVEFEPDLAKVLKRSDVDAVACDAPTNRHAEIMVAAANAGKHIFTEKVLALTVDECKQISDAVAKAGVKFCISFPFRTRPEVLYAHKAVEDGLLGQLTFVRVRIAHNGGSGGWLPKHFWDPAQCGGGAMMDLGAHPMYLARYFGGQPKRITSTFNYMTGHEVEDNAVSVIEFENKVIGVAETSFVSTHSPFSLELSGTEGSVLVGGIDERAVKIRSNKLDGQNWVTPESLPEALPGTTQIWVDGILRNAPIPFDTEAGTQLTELMQYAYVAHKEGRQVEIPKR